MIAPIQKIAVEPMIVNLRPYLFVIGYTAMAAKNDPSCSRPTVRDETEDAPPVEKSYSKDL